MKLLSVGDVARRLGVRPAQITQAFYDRRLRDDLCPIVAGRRLIPESYVPQIAAALRRKGIEVASSTEDCPTRTRGDKRGAACPE